MHPLHDDSDAFRCLVSRGGNPQPERGRHPRGQAEILAGEDGLLGLAQRPSAAIQQLDGDAQFSVAEFAGRDAVAGAPIGQREGDFRRTVLGAGD